MAAGAPLQRRTLSINDAATVLGVGRTKVYELIGAKRLKVVRLGRRTLVTSDSIDELVQAEAA
jgi:excisionase family DNA binding protein